MPTAGSTRNDAVSVSSASESSSGDEADWLDVEPGLDEHPVIVSLLDDSVFTDVTSMLDHCKKQYSFDFLAVRRQLGLDFYGTVKLVNFIRQRAHDGLAPPQSVTTEDIQDDSLLKPVITDDALILALDDLDICHDATIGTAGADAAASSGASQKALLESNAKLNEELEAVKSQFANYRVAVEQTLDKRWAEGGEPTDTSRAVQPSDPSQYYWESYATNDIHETMLKDTIRTDAYRDFVYDNKHLFKDKVVMDIGCGTGILSMFCAKAGAKMVLAIDKSDIIDKARENVYNNGLSDTVTCIRGRVEDISLPVSQVDIIISEWMGYCLTFEAMLPSVLCARDKFLKPDGLLVPSMSSIWLAPVSDPEFVTDHVSFWDDVYGFNMKAMQEKIYDDARIDVWPSSTVCGSASQVAHWDLHTVQAEDLEFQVSYQSSFDRHVDKLDGFLVWFDIFFTSARSAQVPAGHAAKPSSDRDKAMVSFTTGPWGAETHWKQGFLHINQTKKPTDLKLGTEVTGNLEFKAPKDQPRALDISVGWSVEGSSAQGSQTWKLR